MAYLMLSETQWRGERPDLAPTGIIMLCASNTIGKTPTNRN
jgi:hypothetical protein